VLGSNDRPLAGSGKSPIVGLVIGLVIGLGPLLRTPPFASGRAQNPSGFATADGSDPRGLSAGLQQPSEKNGLRQIMS
jgi:hypothetical protein